MMKIAGIPEVTVRAPGKVNLELTVGAPDEQGMHPLATVFQAVSVYEEVTATMARSGSGITITVGGRDAKNVPTDSSNIVFQAATKLARPGKLVEPAEWPDGDINGNREWRAGAGMWGGLATR